VKFGCGGHTSYGRFPAFLVRRVRFFQGFCCQSGGREDSSGEALWDRGFFFFSCSVFFPSCLFPFPNAHKPSAATLFFPLSSAKLVLYVFLFTHPGHCFFPTADKPPPRAHWLELVTLLFQKEGTTWLLPPKEFFAEPLLRYIHPPPRRICLPSLSPSWKTGRCLKVPPFCFMDSDLKRHPEEPATFCGFWPLTPPHP